MATASKIRWTIHSDGSSTTLWQGIGATVHRNRYYDGDGDVERWCCVVWTAGGAVADAPPFILLDTIESDSGIEVTCPECGIRLCEWVMRSHAFDPETHELPCRGAAGDDQTAAAREAKP